ncbi:MAG: hypothetical protein ACJASQ_004295 [Crocinitomicaceae bacterium]|jgi:hypothetical protein
MANIQEFDAYNIVDQTTRKRMINVEHVVEITNLSIGDDLTRIKLINGDFIDVQKKIADVRDEINS